MTTQSLDRYIVATPGTLGGKARIAGRRISIEDIAICHLRLAKPLTRSAQNTIYRWPRFMPRSRTITIIGTRSNGKSMRVMHS
jgi:hypothetical protein